MSESSLQGLLRQTVELLFSHPIIIIIIIIIPWSQLVRLLLFNTTHTNSIPVLLCAFRLTPLTHICNHIRNISTAHHTTSLDEKTANVTKSSRADCQVCADGCAQAVPGQEQRSQQDASKIALRYFHVVSGPSISGLTPLRMLHVPSAKEEVRRRPELLQSLQEFRSPVRIQATTMVE